MRSLICFAFLMSASICMLTVTPVQASANGDAASTLTASPSGNSDSVLADSDADGEVEDKTQEQIKKEKDEFDVEIAAKAPGISDVEELIENEKKKLKEAGVKTTTDDLIALGIPDPAKYDTEKEWHKAFSDWTKKNGYTKEEAMACFNKWWKVAGQCKNLLAYQRTLAELIKVQKKIKKDKEDHCEKWPIIPDDEGGND